MNTNPLDLLDSLLGDWASPRVRRLVHGILLLVALIVGIWLAADGDWKAFAASMLAVVYTAANVANTPATDLAPAGVDRDADDGLSYEESGGMPMDDYPDDDDDLAASTDYEPSDYDPGPMDEPLGFDSEAEQGIYQPQHRRET